MEAVLALVLAAGVTVAVKVLPSVRVIAESVPPETVISLLENVVPGFSEKLKVMMAVSVALRGDLEVVIVSVGATASTLVVWPVKARLFNSTLALLSPALEMIISGLPSLLTSPKAKENCPLLPVEKLILG